MIPRQSARRFLVPCDYQSYFHDQDSLKAPAAALAEAGASV